MRTIQKQKALSEYVQPLLPGFGEEMDVAEIPSTVMSPSAEFLAFLARTGSEDKPPLDMGPAQRAAADREAGMDVADLQWHQRI